MLEDRLSEWPASPRFAGARGVVVALYGVGVVAAAFLGAAYVAETGPWGTPPAVFASLADLWGRWSAASGVGPFEGLAYAGVVLMVVGLLDVAVGTVRTMLSTDGSPLELPAMADVSSWDPLAALMTATPTRTEPGDAVAFVPRLVQRLPSASPVLPSTTAVPRATAVVWTVLGVVFGYGPVRGFVRGELLVSAAQAVALVCVGAVVHHAVATRSRDGALSSGPGADLLGGVTGVAIGFAFTSQLWALTRAIGGHQIFLGVGLVVAGLVVMAAQFAPGRRPSRGDGLVGTGYRILSADDSTTGIDTTLPEEQPESDPTGESPTEGGNDGGLAFGSAGTDEEPVGLADRPSRWTYRPHQLDREEEAVQERNRSTEDDDEESSERTSSDDR